MRALRHGEFVDDRGVICKWERKIHAIPASEIIQHPLGHQAGVSAALAARGLDEGWKVQYLGKDRGKLEFGAERVVVVWRPRTFLQQRASRTTNTIPRWMRRAM